LITAAFAMHQSFQIPPLDDDRLSPVVVVQEDDGMITVRNDEYNTFMSRPRGRDVSSPFPDTIAIVQTRLRLKAHLQAAKRLLMFPLPLAGEGSRFQTKPSGIGTE
jgi:hypothetical protein